MNSVLKMQSSRLSYSCSCKIMKSSCIVLKNIKYLVRVSENTLTFSMFFFLSLPAYMDTEMESESRVSHLHRNRESLTKQLTCKEGRQLVPVTHTRILCSSEFSSDELVTTPAYTHRATWSTLPH